MGRRWVAVLGAVTVAVAGCADSRDDDAPPATEPLTKAQFITKADGVCRDVKKAHRPYAEKVDALPAGVDIKRVAPLLEGALAQSRKGLARLRSLPAPAQDRAALNAYFAAAEKLLEAHAQLADAARTNNRKTGEKVARTTGALSSNERRLGSAYGFKDCDNVF